MEGSVLPWSIEWWHIVLTLTVVILGVVMKAAIAAIKAFAAGFEAWAEKLDSLRQSLDTRMSSMERDFASRLGGMEAKFVQHQGEVHHLTIRVERRVTWLEAHMHREHGTRPLPEARADEERERR